MKKAFYLAWTLFIYSTLHAQSAAECEEYYTPEQLILQKQAPYDNMFELRNYPIFERGYPAYENALREAKEILSSRATQSYNLSWLTEGPYNIGGRINTIAIHPTNKNIMYIGVADGGIFKTIDAGTTWTPIFDNQGKLTIGDISIDPFNPNVIYAATGDPNISGFPAIGDGLYRSINSGATWSYIGLKDDKIISKIEIHPSDSNLLFCATMGMPFYKTNERGLYRSSNRGSTWTKILFLSDSTGIIDFETHPSNPNIIYASSWTRIRNNHEGIIDGIESGVYKTTNGGINWSKLSGGLPAGVNSRVTIEMSKQNPNKLYALVVDTFLDVGGVFKTTDAGSTWTSCSLIGLPSPAQGNFGWYFDGIKINPYNDENIFVLGVNLFASTDGGNSISQIDPAWWTYEVHADKHDLVFASADTIYLATDGGLYRTTDFGSNWTDEDYIPNTEFYHITVNPHETKQYAGGAQDNGTTWGNSTDAFWPRIYGGDGFTVQFVATDPSLVYAETQNGGLVSSDDGGANFNDISITTGDRTNWDQPYIISKHNPDVMYSGTYKLYKNTIAPLQNWSSISGDLTDGLVFEPRFHNISTIAESPFRAGLLYVGTSDGNVWRTDNDGAAWVNITATLPNHYITRVICSKIDTATIYVCNSGYKEGDTIPHIHVSHDKGATWTNISGNLPALGINDVESVSLTDSLLFVANDGGVYYTMDAGTEWKRLGNNMPFIWVFDVEVDAPNKRLVAGTFARSIQSIPIDSILNYYTNINAIANISDDTICAGETITLSASGGSAYLWSPTTDLSCSTCAITTATPTSDRTYIVQVSSGSAIDFDTVHVTVHPLPTAPVISFNRDTLFATGTGIFEWNRGGATVTGADQNYLVTNMAGTYYVTLYNEFNCAAISSPLVFNGFSSVGMQNPSSSEFLIYPIYSSEELKICFNANTNITAQLSIYDISGKIISQSMIDNVHIGNNEETVSIANIPAGIYLYKLDIGGEIKQGKLVIGW